MLPDKELDNFLAFGHRTLDKSRELILNYASRGFSSELKSDKTVVTDADKAAEELIREELRKEFPKHDIIGEEFGGEVGAKEYQWIIDPIDGTANFLTGIPTYGTIFALYQNGEPIVALTDHPALNWRFHSKRGGGVFFGERKVSVRGLSTDKLSELENIAISSRKMFEMTGDEALHDEFFVTHQSIRVYRDCFAHGLIAFGALGGMVEYNNEIWDLAAAKLFTVEGGGVYFEYLTPGLPEGSTRRSAIFGATKTVEALKNFFIRK